MKSPELIWNEARNKAAEAAEQANRTLPPEHQRGFDCGFAWVCIEDGDCEFAKYLRKRGVGDKKDHLYEIWYSELHECNTQSISVHVAAAEAFANALVENGINSFADSRLD
jgi:hypothetical protein